MTKKESDKSDKKAGKKPDTKIQKNPDARKKICLIAGALGLPFVVRDSLIKSGYDVFVVGLKNFVDEKLNPDIVIRLGAGGTAATALKKRGITDIVMAGAIGHPNLADIRPDWWSIKIAAKVLMHDRGYDSLFQSLLSEIEKKGFHMVGVQDVCPDIILKAGVAGKIKPSSVDKKDIARAVECSHIIGDADIGQSVVVDRLVLGVEGADGTDALLKRCAPLRTNLKKQTGVFAKMKKPHQDVRVDLPAIGMGTMKSIKEAGLRGLVVDAKYCLFVEKEEVIKFADKNNIFIYAI